MPRSGEPELHRPRFGRCCVLALLLATVAAATAAAAPLEPAHFTLDNGMTFLVVERPGRPLVAAVWAVRGGSASDPPGRRGLAHVVEHLLYAGSRTIGTRDWEEEAPLLRGWERLYEQSLRRGAAVSGLDRAEQRLSAVQRPGAFSGVYTRAGALGIDAVTRHDSTTFQTLVPKEKIELWFWMESDRLLEPVFRGFRRELAVVEQERRQRIDSSPAGVWFELFDAAYWGAGHPYAHSPGGERLEVARLLPADARSHFETRYRPDRLVAVLVGELSPERARALAERYFGRLGRGGRGRGREGAAAEGAEKVEEDAEPALESIEGSCVCRSQVEIRYPTVPFAAGGDAVALDVLAGLLNSRSGRLYRDLVVGEGRVAFAASAAHVSRRLGGYFALRIEAGEGVGLEKLIPAWDRLLGRLRTARAGDAELERVRRQLLTDSWRQLEQDATLAHRLAAAEALGGWRQLTEWLGAAAAVSADDLERVIDRYLRPADRAVLSLTRTGNAGR
jgi:predicted Zn-dependent peptidase